MFLLEYLKHPVRVGAIAPSSKVLAQEMMKPVDFENARVIVEYGPGTGSFTKELFVRKKPETKLVLIEQNQTFFQEMTAQYHGKNNTVVLHGSAEDAVTLLSAEGHTQADVVISGLPFTSLPQSVTLGVFDATKRILGERGIFVTFQYSRVKEKLFAQHFLIVNRSRVRRNLPPAYIYVLKNP